MRPVVWSRGVTRCVVMGDLLRAGGAKILLDSGRTAKGGCWGDIIDGDPSC